MSKCEILQGDVRETLRAIPDGSVHCCVTSPPYWGLRDYGVEGQLGLEKLHDCLGWATGHRCGECYICRMTAVFMEVHRVLRDDGTLFLNIGDSYAGSWGNYGGQNRGNGTQRAINRGSQVPNPAYDGRERVIPPSAHVAGLKPKDLCGIPWRLAFSLQASGWYLRQDVIWHKPNPMPESVTDRCTKAHEYIFILSKSERYFWDQEAVKEASQSGPSDIRKMLESQERIGGKHKTLVDPFSAASSATNIGHKRAVGDPSGRNPRSVWTITTKPYPGSHFATFPPELPERCIKAGTSAKGCCPTCGKPWVRIVEKPQPPSDLRNRDDVKMAYHTQATGGGQKLQAFYDANPPRTLGWEPTCDHGGEPVPCRVLDPFGGSGTTGQVAIELGRDCTLIELNPKYVELIRRRLDGAQMPLIAEAVA